MRKRPPESPLCSLAVRIERGVRGIYFRMYNHARENSTGSFIPVALGAPLLTSQYLICPNLTLYGYISHQTLS